MKRKTTKRRGRGESSIFQRGDGLWVARVSLGVTPEGKPVRKTIYGKTKEEALAKLDELKRRLYLKDEVTGADTPLRCVIDLWLSSVKVAGYDPGTHAKLTQLAEKHILPSLGHMPIGNVKPYMVPDWLLSLANQGASPLLCRRCCRCLAKMFKWAIRYNYVRKNEAEAALEDMPREGKQEKAIRAMDKAQARAFLIAAEAHRLHAFWILALDSGARMGELLALEWADVDLDVAMLSITKTVKTNEKGGVARVKVPKTPHSRRRIRLTAATVEALRKWKAKTGGSKLLFPARQYAGRPERHMLKSSLTKAFKMVLRRAGLPSFRFHDLRHTTATLALMKTRNVVAVSRRLGHADPSITLRVYAQWMPSFEEEVVNALEPLLKVQIGYSEETPSPQVLAIPG